jgi:hypothetical protein
MLKNRDWMTRYDGLHESPRPAARGGDRGGEAVPSIVSDLMHRPWRQAAESSTSLHTLETNALIRVLTRNERFADHFHRKLCKKIALRVFRGWAGQTQMYMYLRGNMKKCYQLKYLGRRFYAWRFVGQLSKRFRVCIKSYWRRHRLRRFKWWKLLTQWAALKERIYAKNFDLLVRYMAYRRRIKQNWQHIVARQRLKEACIVVQRVFRWHRPRYVHWARVMVKSTVLSHCLLRLHRKRKYKELIRGRREEAATKDMIERGLLYLRKLLQDTEGRALYWIYLREVKQRWNDKPNRHFVFPDKVAMPEIGMKWTVRGKAMHILRHRCAYEVEEFTRIKFREFSPPLYACHKCDETFLFKKHKLWHIGQCEKHKDEPTYLSWSLARSLIDAAVTPLLTRFYQREKLMANK